MQSVDSHRGQYFRVDYDEDFDRFSFHRPDWWDVREYLAERRTIDVGWYGSARDALAAGQRTITVGRLTDDMPLATATVLNGDVGSLTLALHVNHVIGAKVLLLCGVHKSAERKRLLEFNKTAGTAGGYIEPGWVRPYRLRERPLCAAVWLIDKNDAFSTATLNSALQALSAAYFRSKWVA